MHCVFPDFLNKDDGSYSNTGGHDKKLQKEYIIIQIKGDLNLTPFISGLG
jgi:hypothetical protein